MIRASGEILCRERNTQHFSQEGWKAYGSKVYFQLPVIEVFLKDE